MKLILCHQCQDVFKFGTKSFKSCDCGNVKAKYIDSVNAKFYCENDDYSLIGFANGTLVKSINQYKEKKEKTGYKLGEMGIGFNAFIIPEPCPSIVRMSSEDSHLIIKDKVECIIAETLDLPESSINEMESLREECGADDLDILEIALAIDEEYGTSINELDLLGIDTAKKFGDIVISEIKKISSKK